MIWNGNGRLGFLFSEDWGEPEAPVPPADLRRMHVMSRLQLSKRERKAASALGALAGVVAGGVIALGAPTALAQAGNSPGQGQQQDNPFAPKPPQVRELPSILERDAAGKVVWIEGDPARKAIEVMDLSSAQRRAMRKILADRDAQLLRAAVPNLDKIVRALQAEREGASVEFDAFGRHLMGSLGAFGRRGAFNIDSEVRQALPRGVYSDLNIIIREYNLARVAEERELLEAQYAASGEEVSEVMLRDSTILQRFQQRDVIADAARMLEERLGGMGALVQKYPHLAEHMGDDAYWVALSTLGDKQLGMLVYEQTGLEVFFPSPNGEEALTPLARQALVEVQQQREQGPPEGAPAGNEGNAGGGANSGEGNAPRRPRVSAQSDVQRDADGNFSFTDEELEVLRVNASVEPAILKRGPDGLAIRLNDVSFVEAYKAMRDAGMVSDLEIEEFELLLEDRDRVFHEQVLRLYEFLLKAASYGPVEEGPLADAVLNQDWEYWSTMFGAWLNEKLPAPSTVHNDLRVREVLQWDNLVKMSQIANEYDGGHIFDARIELLKMVRDREDMDDSAVALPGNIKRPWRLQQIIRDAKASYARQLRVTDPDFRQVLAGLDLEGKAAELVEELAKADGPMTAEDFWAVAVELPVEAHRKLIKDRTGYDAPEPGFFEGKVPTPTTGASNDG